MSSKKFLTVSDDLIAHADAALNYFRHRGYRIFTEPQDLEFPYAPTFVGKRSPTRLIVEVVAVVPTERVEQWVRYGRSCTRDTRLGLSVPTDRSIPESSNALLVERGVGLYRSTAARVSEVLVPRDLALNVELPELRTLPAPLRRLLGPVYEKFDRGDWREGFEEACHVLENEARDHLKRGIRSKRITVLNGRGNPRILRMPEIDRMTLGQLAGIFTSIQNQNYIDSTLAGALPRINQDRIAVVHRRQARYTEQRLRSNVGRNMWAVINCLRTVK